MNITRLWNINLFSTLTSWHIISHVLDVAYNLCPFICRRMSSCVCLLLHVSVRPSIRLMRRLQSVQNAAARLITVAPRRDHITPILWQLHWLPVRRRVDFKIAVLVFQCLTGQAPGYLAEDCRLVADVSACQLPSAVTATCVTHRTSNRFGDRCFAAAGPRLWNSLPISLRQCSGLEQLKRLLKTFLFSVWSHGACDICLKVRCI